MKFSKAIVAMIAGVSFAGIASAQDAAAPAAAAPATAAPAASAEKKAMIQELIPTAYGSVELRHKTNRVMTDDKVVEDNVQIQARPSLGATFFDGKLDASATYIFAKTNDSTAIKKSLIFSDVYLTAVESKFGDLKAYVYSEYAAGGLDKFTSTSLMAYFSTDGKDILKFSTGLGEVGALFEEYVGPTYHSGTDQPNSKVAQRDGFDGRSLGLVGDAGDEVKQRDPDISTITVLLPYIKPSIVPGLKLSAGFEGYSTHAPKYEVSESGNISQNGYALSKSVVNRATISYKLTDKVVIANSVRQSVNGAWESGVDNASRWENRLVLSATLF